MPSPFAVGKRAKGICDRCGLTFKLKELKNEYVHGRNTHIKTCPKCWDVDHPLNFAPDILAARGADPQAVREPRPDVYPIAYAVKLQPSYVAQGFTGQIIAIGMFGADPASVVFDQLANGLTATSFQITSPMRILLNVTVGNAVPVGVSIGSFTDKNGQTLKAQLTIT